MGLFGPSREEQERRRQRAKAFADFRRLVVDLKPEWSLNLFSDVVLEATAPCEGETLEFRIELNGSITDEGDVHLPGGYERLSFSVKSPSLDTFLIMEMWNRCDFKEAWDQTTFDWFVALVENSAPLADLRARRSQFRRKLSL